MKKYWGLILGIFLILSGVTSVLQAQIPSEILFPSSTKGFFAINDTKVLKDHWEKTELFAVLQNPAFDPFRKEFSQKIETSWTSRFGLTFENIGQLPSGEVAGGLIALPGKKPGFVLLMDVRQNKEKVNDFLKRLAQKWEYESKKIISGSFQAMATVFIFPPTETYSLERRAYYLELGDFLIVADQEYLAALMLERLGSVAKRNYDGALADDPAYRAVMVRVANDRKNPKEVPQLRFFAKPLEYGEAIRSISVLSEIERQKPSVFTILAKQGFDGIKGIGGTFDLTSENYESVTRLKIYIPEPAERALRMLSFQNASDFSAPDWMTDRSARCSMGKMDLLEVFNNVGGIIDEQMEMEGAWEDILESLEKDRSGPQVNLRTDLVGNLGNQYASLTEYDKPMTEDGEKFLFSFDIKKGKEAVVAQTLQRLVESDEEMKSYKVNDIIIWHFTPSVNEPAPEQQRPSVRPGVGNLTVKPPVARNSNSSKNNVSTANNVPTTEKKSGSETDSPLFGNLAFCVSGNYLFVSNNLKYLVDVVSRQSASVAGSIETNADYRKIMDVIEKETAQTGRCFQLTTRSSETVRPTYELFRAGKIASARSLAGRLVHVLLTEPDGTSRSAVFDGSLLPSFDSIENDFGPNGFFGVAEKDGFFYKGFFLGTGSSTNSQNDQNPDDTDSLSLPLTE